MNEPTPRSGEAVVRIAGLSRQFARKMALVDVSLEIPRGAVYGLVGENGAGKTTLIKHILGLYRATVGSVQVFGMNPVEEPEAVLGRIGYLSEDRELPGWMRVSELMKYTQAFYPQWDSAYADALCEMFELDKGARLKHLSRGELAKAGLLAALAHRPDLLLLDEPSSGLDPVVRRDILSAVIRTVAEEGRTVLFSSHNLDEVERVADHVTMIYHGRVVMNTSMDDLRDLHHRVVLRGLNGHTEPPRLPGMLSVETHRGEWSYLCEGTLDAVKGAAAGSGAELLEIASPSLEDIFVALAKGTGLPARMVDAGQEVTP
ncbi:MAG: ABC transporter ATP-binding protein [Candidatus Hydrogenedentes bacterium]|nr:ABC transporter ATP-binding protein [Candidatus Hydrogenedentota bacterium]